MKFRQKNNTKQENQATPQRHKAEVKSRRVLIVHDKASRHIADTCSNFMSPASIITKCEGHFTENGF